MKTFYTDVDDSKVMEVIEYQYMKDSPQYCCGVMMNITDCELEITPGSTSNVILKLNCHRCGGTDKKQIQIYDFYRQIQDVTLAKNNILKTTIESNCSYGSYVANNGSVYVTDTSTNDTNNRVIELENKLDRFNCNNIEELNQKLLKFMEDPISALRVKIRSFKLKYILTVILFLSISYSSYNLSTINVISLSLSYSQTKSYKHIALELIDTIDIKDMVFEESEIYRKAKVAILYRNKYYTKCIDLIDNWLWYDLEHRELMFGLHPEIIQDQTLIFLHAIKTLCYYRKGNFKEAYRIRDYLVSLFPDHSDVISLQEKVK